ncbi:MAG: prepilin-type N-terminal cleavage/methylation domain-containing protein [Candidatus Wildermuthbacteria bacterium]|nr:prepilin-type N-terminal cleavage/methylation domain-containing protein [Candidatus Wildermuthbacteria bacterium]
MISFKFKNNFTFKISDTSGGFTIPEMLVALMVFSLVAGGGANILFTGISAQRYSLASQELLDQSSFMAEYISRALRQAQKDITPICLSAGGLNYEITRSGRGVKFVNKNGQCQEFYSPAAGTRIWEKIGSDPEYPISSDNLTVNTLLFAAMGQSQSDDQQPRVTVFIDMEGEGGKPESRPRVHLQTSVSQRAFDVVR